MKRMKRMMGPLSLGMIMGASLTGVYFMMPRMKKNKKCQSPYTCDHSSVNE